MRSHVDPSEEAIGFRPLALPVEGPTAAVQKVLAKVVPLAPMAPRGKTLAGAGETTGIRPRSEGFPKVSPAGSLSKAGMTNHPLAALPLAVQPAALLLYPHWTLR